MHIFARRTSLLNYFMIELCGISGQLANGYTLPFGLISPFSLANAGFEITKVRIKLNLHFHAIKGGNSNLNLNLKTRF